MSRQATKYVTERKRRDIKITNCHCDFCLRVNLDLGHFTAGNNDAVAFLRTHHDRVTHLHVKDRRRNGGPNVALGTGDTPIRECLQLIRDNKWDIVCALEREGPTRRRQHDRDQRPDGLHAPVSGVIATS